MIKPCRTQSYVYMDDRMGTITITCPFKYKYQLVNWLVTYRGWKESHAKKLSKPQLYAIWYKS